MVKVPKILATFLRIFTMYILFGANIATPSNWQIAILFSKNAIPYQQAFSGFEEYFQKQGIRINCQTYTLDVNAGPKIQTMMSSKPNLILVLGSAALEKALNQGLEIPIIAGVVLRMDPFKKRPNLTGVVLEFPVETQLKWLQSFLPNTKNIGTIYSVGENRERMESISKIAAKMGLKLEAHGIETPHELPEALHRLSKRSDVFWGIPDSSVLNAQTGKDILLFSFQNRIPFIGLSSSWVKAGALYSLEWDYVDMGRQCAEMAVKVLQGVPAHTLPVVTPRKIHYTLNLNTASFMKIIISDDLIRGAYQTF